MPRCGALSLLQKTPHYRGDPAETAARLNVKLWTSATGGGGGGGGGILPPFLAQSIISPTHKRTEGRAPVWGSEFTSKDAALQGGSEKLLLG